jgi:lysophosphatidylcholine acyltransferase / lyso-PAF acetyltransferase
VRDGSWLGDCMDNTTLMMQPSAEEAQPPAADMKAPRLVSRQSESLLQVVDVAAVEELPHPFLNGTPRPQLLDWVKMILLLPLALVRVILIVAMVLIAAPFAYLALCGYDPGPDPLLPNPLPCWRKALFLPIRFATRGMLFCFGYMWIPVKGRKAPATEAPLLVPNHLGAIEPFYLMCRYGVSHVAKADTINTPIMGVLAKGMLQIFVRRSADDKPTPGDGTLAARDTAAAIEKRAQNMGAGGYPTLALYPEATTTNGRCLLNFKTGAFRPGCPVQPCIIKHPYCWFDPTMSEGKTYYYWRLLTQCYNTMTVEFLPTIVPTAEEQHDAVLFATLVRREMAEASGLQLTDHALADFFLMKDAKKAGLRGSAAVNVAIDTPVGKLKDATQLSEADIKFYMKRFADADTTKTGMVQLADFEQALQVEPGNDYVRELFELFDQDDNGALHWAEFVSALLYINAKVSASETARLAFSLFDTNEDGKVQRADIEQAAEKFNLAGAFATEGMQQLFEEMDSAKRGYVEVEQAVQWVEEHPEAMTQTRKTALLQQSAPALVRDRAAAAAAKPRSV